MRFIFVFLVFCFSFFSVSAQFPSSFERKAFFLPADSQKIFFSFAGSSFFKNNEYFSSYEQGYTLPGFRFQPSVIFQLSSDLRIQTGAEFHKFWGRDEFYAISPLFRAQYQPVPWFQTIVGTLYGGSFHRLSEPLYRWEKDFSDSPENGLQFLFNTQPIIADIWLNWSKYIQHGDPFQEELTVGISSELFLTKRNSQLTLSIPFQALFQHHGGQIDSANLPLQTLSNGASGVRLKKQFKGKYLRFIESEVLFVGYSDLSPQKLQQFKNGFGINPKIKAGLGNFSTELGYFHGTRFISISGERLFHSFANPYNTRNLLTGKVWFTKAINEGISISAYLETYTCLTDSRTDYAYGIHILFNREFFLLKY